MGIKNSATFGAKAGKTSSQSKGFSPLLGAHKFAEPINFLGGFCSHLATSCNY